MVAKLMKLMRDDIPQFSRRHSRETRRVCAQAAATVSGWSEAIIADSMPKRMAVGQPFLMTVMGGKRTLERTA